MKLLYYCIVGDPLIYRGEGVCWGDTFSPTDTSWEASSHTIDHMFYFSTLPLDQFVIFILQSKNSS
jgi:hypothetical protein